VTRGNSVEVRGQLDEVMIGVEQIDAPHREFVRNLAALREALVAGSGGRERMLQTLRYLDELVTLRFSAEEEYMRRHNYPGILLHVKEHAAFARQFAELKRHVLDLDARGEITAFTAIDVERMLRRWLTDHIANADRKFGEFLSGRR
jgi:hemerythrin